MNLLFIATPALDQFLPVALFIAGLLVVWIIIRFFLRLAMRVFMLGCVLIVMIALTLAALSYFGFLG